MIMCTCGLPIDGPSEQQRSISLRSLFLPYGVEAPPATSSLSALDCTSPSNTCSLFGRGCIPTRRASEKISNVKSVDSNQPKDNAAVPARLTSSSQISNAACVELLSWR